MAINDLLKSYVIAVTGDFGEQRTHEKMRGWIQSHGGKYAYDISAKVTHLVASHQHYKNRVAMVKQAEQLSIQIVSFDWLEDTLLNRERCPERKYRLEKIIRSKQKTKEQKRATRIENIKKGSTTSPSPVATPSLIPPVEDFERGCLEFQKDMFSANYHIYHDSTSFAYDITVARANLSTNTNERHSLKVGELPIYTSFAPFLSTPCLPSYAPPPAPHTRVRTRWPTAQRLQLYESHALPRLYACYSKYSSPGQNAAAEMIAPIGSSFDTAFMGWRVFFEAKTLKRWDLRLVKSYVLKDGGAGAGVGAFVYLPPREGEPRGVLGYEDLERREEEEGREEVEW